MNLQTPNTLAPRNKCLHPELKRYMESLGNLVAAYQPSLFWERELDNSLISGLIEDIHGKTEQEIVEGICSLRYGFTDLPEGCSQPDRQEAFQQAWQLWQTLDQKQKAIRKELKQDANLLEHAQGLRFLDRQGLLEDYVNALAKLRITSSFSNVRHFYYARLIQQISNERWPGQTHDFLEIGAGAGNLAVFLKNFGLVQSYTIVDLPEMLVNAAYTITNYLPEYDIRFCAENNEFTPAKQTASFIPASHLNVLNGSFFSIALNFNSFMEMDKQAIDGYFNLIYRCCKPKSLFLNVNRRQRALPQRDGTSFDNNPLFYPYRPTDQVLQWEEDVLQQVMRSGYGVVPSLVVIRAALISPDAS